MPRAALVRAGLALWLVSFVTPDSRAHSLGGAWLLRAPLRGTQLLAHALATSGSNRWQAAGLGMALLLGFAANFTLLLRPGNRALLLAATLPWIPWLTYLQLWQRGTLAAASPPWTLLYFYPWVLGLLLVQVGRLPLRAHGEAAGSAMGRVREECCGSPPAQVP